MRLSPLNLISTPVPVLNSLGLDLRVGLSSEDPMVGRHPSEAYKAYLSIYSPEGPPLQRRYLGEISPNRRRFFDISAITRELVPKLDHLTVVHRIPSRLLSEGSDPEHEIELATDPDYSLFRSLVEYSFPKGGNGSVIYETPPRLNTGPSSNTLTFTCQVVLSEILNTHLVLINYSMDPSYSQIANYSFGVYSLSGKQVVSDSVIVGPFGIRILDMAGTIPKQAVSDAKDGQDGLSTFNFVGYSENAAVLVLCVNAAPDLRAVAVEHTHPPQTYLFPADANHRWDIKKEAKAAWKSILSVGSGS